MSMTPYSPTVATVNKFFGAADTRLSNAALTGATKLGQVATKGGLLGKGAGLLSKGLQIFSNFHPAAKLVALAGTAVLAGKAASSSSHPAAQRVA